MDKQCWVPSCDRMDTKPYISGPFCPDHTPAKRAGRPEPPTGDASWMDKATPTPSSARGATDIDKDRPGGYVSRQKAQRIAAGKAPRQARRAK